MNLCGSGCVCLRARAAGEAFLVILGVAQGHDIFRGTDHPFYTLVHTAIVLW